MNPLGSPEIPRIPGQVRTHPHAMVANRPIRHYFRLLRREYVRAALWHTAIIMAFFITFSGFLGMWEERFWPMAFLFALVTLFIMGVTQYHYYERYYGDVEKTKERFKDSSQVFAVDADSLWWRTDNGFFQQSPLREAVSAYVCEGVVVVTFFNGDSHYISIKELPSYSDVDTIGHYLQEAGITLIKYD